MLELDLELKNNTMKKLLILLLVSISISAVAQDTAIKQYENAPRKFKKGVDKMLTPYLQLKDAFVKEENATIVSSATEITDKLNAISIKGLSAEQLSYFNEHKAAINSQCQKLTNDSFGMEQKRLYFEKLTHSVYAIVKSFKANGIELYRQYCPMAINGKGAFWLSNRDIIINPYFGKKMLNCGDVVEVL